MIEKLSGQIAYAVGSFGGFLGLGAEEYTLPWKKLTYDTSLGGYRTDINEEQLRRSPAFSRDETYDWPTAVVNASCTTTTALLTTGRTSQSEKLLKRQVRSDTYQ
jgi:hypothetical protein